MDSSDSGTPSSKEGIAAKAERRAREWARPVRPGELPRLPGASSAAHLDEACGDIFAFTLSAARRDGSYC
jgi:hypothetical protein